MSSVKFGQAALGSIKTFRNRELSGLIGHLRKFGPLPESTTTTTSTISTTKAAGINLPNPFIPKKHPKTGRWHEPKYSLRRQADLVKNANLTGTLHLLPSGPKKEAFQLRMDRLKEEGLLTQPVAELKPKIAEQLGPAVSWAGEYTAKKVPGAQLGIRLYAGKKRMFKGHRWERMKLGLLKRRAMLVSDMKERVRNYKEYYKKRRPNPLKPSRYTKPPKLPF